MRDAYLNGFGYNMSTMSVAGRAGWDKYVALNNCYNFATGRQNSKGGGQGVPGRGGGYAVDKWGEPVDEVIKAVVKDGAIYLGFDGTDERYPDSPGSWKDKSVIHLMAAVCDEHSEYHFYRLLKDGWWEKDGPRKQVAPVARAGMSVPTTKAGFEQSFCKDQLPLAVGYFLILPNHKVNNVANVYI